MAGSLIKRYFPLAFFVLFAGCTLSSVGVSQMGIESQNPSAPPPSESTSEGKPTSYFVEIRMKGESARGRFRQASINAYPNGVEFQNTDLSIDQAFMSFEGAYGDEGFHTLYGFSDAEGNNFDIRRYVGGTPLKTPEGTRTLHLYYWIKKKAYLFDRENLRLTVPEHLFDANIHQNVARFTVTAYPDFEDTRPNLIVFDGFKPK